MSDLELRYGQELEHGENCTCCDYELEKLNRVTDKVLAYRPKPKTKAAKRRIRRKRRQSKERESSI